MAEPTEREKTDLADSTWTKDYYKFYTDTAGEWRWTRYAANHRAVGCPGEGYKNFNDCFINALRLGLNINNHRILMDDPSKLAMQDRGAMERAVLSKASKAGIEAHRAAQEGMNLSHGQPHLEAIEKGDWQVQASDFEEPIKETGFKVTSAPATIVASRSDDTELEPQANIDDEEEPLDDRGVAFK